MGVRDRFTRAASFGGRGLPHAGADAPIELVRKGPLGPCKATVVADTVRLESGRQMFRVIETWSPPQEGIGEITETTAHTSATEATRHAHVAAREWAQGSARSEQLAPGGRLRAEGTAVRGTISLEAP